jgi:hypothetical protein
MAQEMSSPAERDEVRRIGRCPDAHPAVARLDVIERHHLEDVGSVRAAPLVPTDVAGIEDRCHTALVPFQDGAPQGGGHGIAAGHVSTGIRRSL